MTQRNFVFGELVLVVAVLLLLWSVTLPSLNRIRSAALREQCEAALKTDMAGFSQYAGDFGGWIFSHLPDGKRSTAGRPWGESLFAGRYLHADSLNCPGQPTAGDDFIHTYGMFRTTLEPGNHFYRARIRRWGDFAHAEAGGLYYRLQRMSSPSLVIALADTELFGGEAAGLGFFAYHPVRDAAGSALSLRHDGEAAQSFADGHVEMRDEAALISNGFCRYVKDGKSVSR